jgi:branched-chain amino acid transport system substrate-binding protein
VRDCGSLVAAVAESDCDAIAMWSLHSEGAFVLESLRAAGLKQPVVGPDGLTTAAFIDRAGRAAEGVVVTLPFDATRDSSVTRTFLSRYRERYGQDACSFAAHGYDGLSIIAQALRRAGPEAEALREALASTKDFPGVTGIISFDEKGNDTREVDLAEVRSGRFVKLSWGD